MSTAPALQWEPTRAEALRRIAAIDLAAYARSRNALGGAVSRLSPYLTHGIVSLPEVLSGAASRHPLHLQHRLVFELGWRAYFAHVWAWQGDRIFSSLHAGPLPDSAYARDVPGDVRQARTGVPVVDTAVRTLYRDGWLHNHARLWLASYLVHLRKVHWRAGADWLVGHLLDGDLASNHLSWQWVAGTGSSKPYVFDAANVARYAPAEWHSPGSVLDQPYEALDGIARSAGAVLAVPQGAGINEPALSAQPPAKAATAESVGIAATGGTAAPAALQGRTVWLVHPWALHAPPPDMPAGALRLGVWPGEVHRRWPWSAQRRAFAEAAMSAVTDMQWTGDAAALAALLHGAQAVQTEENLHIDAWWPAGVTMRPAPQLFPAVDRPCTSFSQWWKRSLRGVAALHELPGLQGAEKAPSDPGRPGAAGPTAAQSSGTS